MFKIDGLKELEAAFADLGKRATSRRVAERALKKAAEPIRDKAKELAPDDPATGTGKYLVAAIKIGKAGYKEQKSNNQGNVVTTFIGIDGSVLPPKPSTRRFNKKGQGKEGGGVAQYSIFQEFGTKSRPAQPYMRPAYEQLKETVAANIGSVVAEEIAKTKDRAARKAARKAGA